MRATRTTVSSRPSSRPATIPRWTRRRARAWARPSARSAAPPRARPSARPRAARARARPSARPRAPSAGRRSVAATSIPSRKKVTSRRTPRACRTRVTRSAESLPGRRTYTLGGGQPVAGEPDGLADRGEGIGEGRPQDRLDEHEVSTRLTRAAHERLVVPRDDDDARPAPRAGQDAANHHFAGDIGQAEVRQDDVEIGAGGQVHGLAAATRRNDVHTLATEQERKDFTNVRGVLHEKHPQSVRLPPSCMPGANSKRDAGWRPQAVPARPLTRPEARWST